MSAAFLASGTALRHGAPALPGHVWAVRIGDWLHVGVTAPHAWGPAHRCTAAAVAAVAAFACCWHGAHMIGLEERLAAQPGPAELARRLDVARMRVAGLPALRLRVSARLERNAGVAYPPSLRWQTVSMLATRHGLTIRTLEPRAVAGDGPQAARPVRMSARASFAGFVGFLRGLSTLPGLVVPTELSVEPKDGVLAIETTLHIYDVLPPAPAATASATAPDDERQPWFHDPFDVSRLQAGSELRAVRLLGIMRDRRRSIAILATSEGAVVGRVGQTVGTERLVRIGPRGVTFAGLAGERALALAEEAP